MGRINRGYESFTLECFHAIKDNDQFDLYLVKGAGKRTVKELPLFNLHRKHGLSLFFEKVFHSEPYITEQVTFCLSMIPLIIKKKPAVIYYSDFSLGTYLWHLRKYFQFKYTLLFSNGAPNGPPYKTEDHVQQLLPVYLKMALEHGEPASKQTLLPYGFCIDRQQRKESILNKERIRTALGFNPKQKVILSVGAINKTHKRMDYVIDEVSKLPRDYFLVLLGQYENETNELITLANEKLPSRYIIANVPYEEVKKYYIAADYFVLASLKEGFGRVLIEALSYGLPCIVHDYVNAREVLKEHAIYINLKENGELSSVFLKAPIVVNRISLIDAAYNLYSWDILKKRYTQMIEQAI